MWTAQQNKRFGSALFYASRDFHNSDEIATESGQADSGRISLKQLCSDIVIDRAIEKQVSPLQLKHRVVEKRHMSRLLNFRN